MKWRVLVVAGSDSGGGAGIQADIKTVTALGGYAATALTALTAQNTEGVFAIHDVPAEFVAEQMRVDGGGFAEVWAHVWLPGVWPTVLVGALAAAGFVLGEVIVSTLLVPPGNWSVAVSLLNQMHFGRYDQTVAGTLLLISPAFVVAGLFGTWMWFRERVD